MLDRRGDILARVEEILQGISGYVTFFRNYAEFPNTKRPALALLDADEMDEAGNNPAWDSQQRMHGSGAPIYVRMHPEIWIVLENQDWATIGPQLNARRVEILAAVLTDAHLIQMCGDRGSVNYRGCSGQIQGQRFEGLMRLMITFTYPLIPRELVSS